MSNGIQRAAIQVPGTHSPPGQQQMSEQEKEMANYFDFNRYYSGQDGTASATTTARLHLHLAPSMPTGNQGFQSGAGYGVPSTAPYHYGQQFAAATGGSQSSSSQGYVAVQAFRTFTGLIMSLPSQLEGATYHLRLRHNPPVGLPMLYSNETNASAIQYFLSL
ncbi:hypothetical protein C8F01DRAFT_1084936 [Mycena amicta]|nr:hypothetical protein C8F01DRAFT_1084936 [Mycena amicta]